MCLLPQKGHSSESLAVDMSDEIFLFPQPVQLFSKENTLVWIAVNEDGVSILDHNTMVWKDEDWLPDLLLLKCLFFSLDSKA